MKVQADADSAPLAPVILEARPRRGALEAFAGARRLVEHLACRQPIAGADDVQRADFVRVEPDPPRNRVHVTLDRKRRLRHPEAPERAVRGRVRPKHPTAHADVRHAIRTGRMQDGS